MEKISLARLILATDPNVEKISYGSKCGKIKTRAITYVESDPNVEK